MNWLIVVAGGKGNRLGLGYNKVFAKIGKYPIIYLTLKAFEKSKVVDKIAVSIGKNEVEKVQKLVKKYKLKKTKYFVNAGKSRQDSTHSVLKLLKSEIANSDLVGVHNGVNPYVAEREISKVFLGARASGAALLACRAKDTIKITNGKGLVVSTPLRQDCWQAQTPQVATYKLLLKAFQKAEKDRFLGTDDAQLLERIGVKPKIIPCSSKNIKITYDEDLLMAKEIYKSFYKNK